jgi:hypothetical protein
MSSDEIYLRDSNVFVEAQHAEAVERLFAGANLGTETDGGGNITYMWFDVQYICVDEEFFKPLIPFMRHGSFFEFCDEMGNNWRWIFHDGTCESIGTILLWPKPGAPVDLSQQIHKAFEQRLMAK